MDAFQLLVWKSKMKKVVRLALAAQSVQEGCMPQ